MTTITHFEEKFGKIYYQENADYYVIQPKGFLQIEQWETLLGAVLQLLMKKRFHKALADHTQMKLINKQASDYIAQVFFPRAITLGLKRVAVVQPNDAFVEITTEKVYDAARDNSPDFIDATFGSIEAAQNWLAKQKISSMAS
ncbi:hypothetical protein [Hugenholtzia roseola]|uniref:hypothetical protein n=1 Tax=Hugenholtzia roseola TaxID=1002 RepID=UPI000427A17E|nr:hypothetical protein [Hugenholtzia roseola]